MPGRISEELTEVDLGDQRLNRRSRQVLDALSVDPQASVNASHEQWSDTLAAYRLFNNPKVTPEAILRPHREATLGRMAEQPTVLALQDTSEMDYSKHPPSDGGCLTKPERTGFYLHQQLPVTSWRSHPAARHWDRSRPTRSSAPRKAWGKLAIVAACRWKRR